MKLDIPDELVGPHGLTKEKLLLDLALGMYIDRKASIGQAARIAALSIPAFLDEMGKREVCIDYGVEDLESDLRTLESLRKTG